MWQGRPLQLASVRSLGLPVPARATAWLRLTAAVPASVGNVVESDTFRFGLHVVLAGNGVSGGSGVAVQHTGVDGIHTGARPDGGIDGLAATGFSTVLFVIGGAAARGGLVLLSLPVGAQRRATSAGHRQHVEHLVQLLLGERAGDVAAFDDDLADRLALGQRLLGDLGGLVVADVVVQRRDDRRRRLGVFAAALDVGLDAGDAPVGEHPRDVGDAAGSIRGRCARSPAASR